MSLNIEWNDFRNTEPPRLGDWYIVETTSGHIHLDRWVHEESYSGPNYEHIVLDKWENTYNSHVERWAEIGDVTLRQYIGLRI